MSRARRGGTVVVPVLAVLLVSCDQSTLPTAPSEVTSGLTVYEHANYLGESALLARSIADLSDYEGPCEHTETTSYGSTVTLDWNDCISSVRVAPGWEATIYRDSDYGGDALNVTGDLPNLQLVQGRCSHDGMNDCITSIKAVRPELVPGNILTNGSGATPTAHWVGFMLSHIERDCTTRAGELTASGILQRYSPRPAMVALLPSRPSRTAFAPRPCRTVVTSGRP